MGILKEKEIDISKLEIGDKILVECTVNAVFPNSGIVMVTTTDCDEGFDAYPYEIKGVAKQIRKRGMRK